MLHSGFRGAEGGRQCSHQGTARGPVQTRYQSLRGGSGHSVNTAFEDAWSGGERRGWQGCGGQDLGGGAVRALRLSAGDGAAGAGWARPWRTLKAMLGGQLLSQSRGGGGLLKRDGWGEQSWTENSF